MEEEIPSTTDLLLKDSSMLEDKGEDEVDKEEEEEEEERREVEENFEEGENKDEEERHEEQEEEEEVKEESDHKDEEKIEGSETQDKERTLDDEEEKLIDNKEEERASTEEAVVDAIDEKTISTSSTTTTQTTTGEVEEEEEEEEQDIDKHSLAQDSDIYDEFGDLEDDDDSMDEGEAIGIDDALVIALIQARVRGFLARRRIDEQLAKDDSSSRSNSKKLMRALPVVELPRDHYSGQGVIPPPREAFPKRKFASERFRIPATTSAAMSKAFHSVRNVVSSKNKKTKKNDNDFPPVIISMEEVRKRESAPAAIAVPIIGEDDELLFADALEEQIMHDYYSIRNFNNNHNATMTYQKRNSGLNDIVSSMDVLPYGLRESVTFFLDPTEHEIREKASVIIQTCTRGFLCRRPSRLELVLQNYVEYQDKKKSATLIQKNIRGHLCRRPENLQSIVQSYVDAQEIEFAKQ